MLRCSLHIIQWDLERKSAGCSLSWRAHASWNIITAKAGMNAEASIALHLSIVTTTKLSQSASFNHSPKSFHYNRVPGLRWSSALKSHNWIQTTPGCLSADLIARGHNSPTRYMKGTVLSTKVYSTGNLYFSVSKFPQSDLYSSDDTYTEYCWHYCVKISHCCFDPKCRFRK